MIQAKLQELRKVFATGRRGEVIAAAEECLAEITKLQKRRERPRYALSEVMAEAERMKWPAGLAEQCHDSYAATGWVYGKSKLPFVDLAATMRTWKRNHDKWNAPADGNKPKMHFDIG